jgi:hypothetical protein
MKTNKLLKLTVVAGTLLTFTARAGLLTPGNPHDFHGRSWNNDPTDMNTVCSVCHTPHHADATAGPLWNHSMGVGFNTGWTMYANGVSPGANIKYTPLGAPRASSLACLSCHDGSIAVNAYGGTVNGTPEFVTNTAAISENSKTLTHSHPISVPYDSIVGVGPGKDKWLYPSGNNVLVPDANTPTFTPGNDMTIRGFLLDQQGYVECNSCHDVHNQEGSAFELARNPNLVKINGTAGGVGSLLCRSCHNK